MVKKNKRGQIFGMSFQMIFSILLIIFFIAVAFIAIKFFLGIQTKSQIGFFLTDLQDELDSAWERQEGSFFFNGTLPSGIDYICFINLSSPIYASNSIEQGIYDEVRYSGISFRTNFVLWPDTTAGDLSFKELKHFQLPERNPYCIQVKKGDVAIKIDKSFDEALPRVS